GDPIGGRPHPVRTGPDDPEPGGDHGLRPPGRRAGRRYPARRHATRRNRGLAGRRSTFRGTEEIWLVRSGPQSFLFDAEVVVDRGLVDHIDYAEVVDAHLQLLGVQVQDELLTRSVPPHVGISSGVYNALFHGTDVAHSVVS